MKTIIFKQLQQMKARLLILVSVLCSVLLSEIIVAMMGLLLKGTVPIDYLLTGLVTSCFVATLIIVMFTLFREQLAENALTLRTIIESQPECVKLLAENGTLLQINPAGLAMIEADSESQVINQSIQHILLPEYRAAFGALIKQVFKGGTGNLEFEICGLKGTHRWLETHAVPLRDSNGNITALLSITRDITDRKQAELEKRANEQKLRDNENKLNTILDNVEAYIYIKDKNYRYQYANRLVRQLFKQPLDAIIGKTDSDFFDSETTANLRNNDRRVIEYGERLASEEVNVSEDGSLCTAYISVKQPLRFDDGTIYGLCGTSTDITERRHAEEQLRASEQQLRESRNFFRSLAQISPVGIYRTDALGHCLYVNQRWCDIAGMNIQQAQGIGWRTAIMADDREKVIAEWTASVHEQRQFAIEYRFQQPSGNIIWVYGLATAIHDEAGNISGYVGTITDITERKAIEEQINHLAFYDSLTQLPNRRLLHERIKHSIEFNHRTHSLMAVLMIDLDKFKAVNDNLGHVAGDELLQQVAERIKHQLRENDTVARLGGDEFVILIEDVKHHEAITDIADIADAIIHTLSQPFTLSENHEALIGASIGISLCPLHGDNVETLLDNADTALYHAKDLGRGCFAYFSEELTRKARERLALEAQLRRAIEQQELRVYFQPQLDIVSNKIIGAEALVRWHDPLHGCISPNVFISLAEETGLIMALGEFVLRETCRLGREWLNAGLPAISLAVNVSPSQFHRCDINALVMQVLSDTGFPAEFLELEITESGLMDNQQQAMAILDNLHKQGIRLAIDDFGTGYSSLAYLKYFPLDMLKIDKTFIDDIPFLQGDMAITATIIAMAHHLDFKVLAEGVETVEQLAFLREHGCDSYQGYLYSKPLPASEFAQLLLESSMANTTKTCEVLKTSQV